ncbi:hypothetical protein [Nocardia ignorata]|uniref:Uncharacterized protein n=1 Tax=Nocardia ignorata TaxID=145285 RepID=A0A4R6P0L1_NOCIG|nr:hypothetical protein [Nocardia ignorata]TDP29802.1 hypothetical protein DFR75_11270 [Nocardia ignorata]
MNFESIPDFTGGPPVEPSSDARQVAAAVYGQYTALTGVGFTEAQAMRLVEMMIAAMAGGGRR